MKLGWLAGIALVACGSATSSQPAVAPPATAPVPVTKNPSLAGIWFGTLQTRSGIRLRIQLHLDDATCSLDDLDRWRWAPMVRVMGIPCTNVVATASSLSFDVPAVHASLKGAVAADAHTVTATWSEPGAEIAVVLTRQAEGIEPSTITFDPPMDAVEIEKIETVLDADLAKLVDAAFAPHTGVGVTIGIVVHGTRKIFSYGGVKPDSVFEIGSITKTFTGLVLAQMVEQKMVRLDEPVRELLPKGTVAQPAGKEITLVDLSTHHSGLPRMPDNFHPKDEQNPYADYDATALYAWIASHGVALPEKHDFVYSNLGGGLLGQALADRAKMSYEALVKKEVLDPLGMKETSMKLTSALMKRFATGHDEAGKPAHAWDEAALAGAGALRSTAADMLSYLEAQLHPDKVTGTSTEAKTLPAALAASHEVRAEAGDGHIALNWLRVDDSGMYWHNGMTGGFSSFTVFDPAKDFGVIVLLNRQSELADQLGQHIIQRLTGQPAPSLVQP